MLVVHVIYFWSQVWWATRSCQAAVLLHLIHGPRKLGRIMSLFVSHLFHSTVCQPLVTTVFMDVDFQFVRLSFLYFSMVTVPRLWPCSVCSCGGCKWRKLCLKDELRTACKCRMQCKVCNKNLADGGSRGTRSLNVAQFFKIRYYTLL